MKFPNKVTNHIVNWLKDYLKKSNMDGFVIGVSGGIDSALTSTLCAKTGYPVQCIEMPINQNKKAGELINKISGSCEIKKAGVYLIKNYRAKKIGKMGLTENPFPSEDK